jgi:hypothetical protein
MIDSRKALLSALVRFVPSSLSSQKANKSVLKFEFVPELTGLVPFHAAYYVFAFLIGASEKACNRSRIGNCDCNTRRLI